MRYILILGLLLVCGVVYAQQVTLLGFQVSGGTSPTAVSISNPLPVIAE